MTVEVITRTPLVAANHIKPFLVGGKFLSHADFKREGDLKDGKGQFLRKER
jgi:hypothetical protein